MALRDERARRPLADRALIGRIWRFAGRHHRRLAGFVAVSVESIRANLQLAAPHAGDDELWDALRRARLADVVAEMPDGLDTVVGERGYRLSGGQRQRLTIARLLLGHSRVVLLDEATASLDSASEAAVQQALSEALAGRASIVITHRLSTVRAAGLIVVVEDGRIVARGTHEQLLARGGRYAELCVTQFGHDTAAA